MELAKVIPCLDIKGGRVVKGVKFVNLRDARDPAEAAAAYCKQGADEIVFLDITATVEKRKTRLDWVKKVAKAVTVPFTVGGGISSLAEMQALFDLGVTKVSLNTAAVRNPDLIEEAADRFGPDKIVLAIDAQKGESGFEVLICGGTRKAGLELVEWAEYAERLGAGEILLTSKDADGTLDGYDIPMILAVADAVTIPVTASGGCGKPEHMAEAILDGHASNVLAASVFHFVIFTIREAKEYLKSRGIPVRL